MHFVDGRSHTINCEQRNYIKKIENGLVQLFYDTVMNSNTTTMLFLGIFTPIESSSTLCNPNVIQSNVALKWRIQWKQLFELNFWFWPFQYCSIDSIAFTELQLHTFYHIWLSIRIQKFVILLCPFISVCFSLLFFSSCDGFMCEYIYADM